MDIPSISIHFNLVIYSYICFFLIFILIFVSDICIQNRIPINSKAKFCYAFVGARIQFTIYSGILWISYTMSYTMVAVRLNSVCP